MRTRYLAATAAAALIMGALVPVTAANAADSTITGVVSGLSGPVPYATVGWIEAKPGGDYGSTEAGSSGDYSLTIPDDVDDYYIYANLHQESTGGASVYNRTYTGSFFGEGGQSGFIPNGLPAFTAPISGDFGISLTAGGAITGVSSIYKGQSIQLKTLGNTDVTSDYVGSDGVFLFDGLAPGKYRVAAMGTGKYTSYLSKTITVQSGVTSELSIAPTVGATISGVVKSGSKKLGGIRVYAYAGEAYGYADTTSTGSYAIKGLRSGNYTVSFSSNPGGRAAYVAKATTAKGVKVGKATKLNASLVRAGVVTGKVTLTKGAKFYSVAVVNSSKQIVGYGGDSKAHRSYSVGGLAAGKYKVYVTDSAGKYYAVKSVTVKAGKATSTGTITLKKKAVTLSGSVTGARSGSVYVGAPGLPGGDSSISSKGKYSIKGLVPGTYTTYVYAAKTSVKTSTVKVKKSTKKTLVKGKANGAVTATVRAGGFPVDYVYGTYKLGKSDSFFFQVLKGTLSASAPAGAASLIEATVVQPFPGLTPYWYELPAKAKKFTVATGKTTKLGTVDLLLKGAPVVSPS